MTRRILSAAFAFSLATGALFLTGCETPNSRISAHPEMFNSLSPADQQAVAAGQIRPGMSKNGVFLAWGGPESRVNGFARGNATETWVYYTTADYGYGGYGYGGYGRGGFGPYGYGYPGFYGGGAVFRTHHGRRFAVFGDPFYDPFFYSAIPPRVPSQTVTFVNGRVVGFQQLAPPYR